MRRDTCTSCGQPIYLVKTGPLALKWVTDLTAPNTSDECTGDPTNQFQRRDATRHRHTPGAMQGTRR